MNSPTQVIYRRGQPGIASEVYVDGGGQRRVRYTWKALLDGSRTPDMLASDYVTTKNAEYATEIAAGEPPFELRDFDEVMLEIEAAQDALFVHPWSEISHTQWREALECQPPEKWQSVAGVELFRSPEATCANIHPHYAALGEDEMRRFFACSCRTTVPYTVLAEQVHEAYGKPPTADFTESDDTES